ncbi:MAG: tRNA (adenosine(37)-N6)-dimethylallyltransferase MiaA [Deltaproteobacteria bacterium]
MTPAPTFVAVLAGPTASGKTRVAIEAAIRAGAEIVNADSQQVYRGLDVGTAKPTPEERAAVPHHLLDIADPGDGMDAARWTSLADQAIREIRERGHVPLVVGGTGLYVRALLHGVVEAPGRDPALRTRLEEEAALHGRGALHRRLAEVDPGAAARIRENDLVRIVRALEIAAGGRTQTELFEAHRFAPRRYRYRLLALDVPRDELHRRIGERAKAIACGGILEEARALRSRLGAPLPRLPIGYADADACAAGEIGMEELAVRLATLHRRYARRQVIWLRREQDVEWLAPPSALPALVDALRTAP